MGQKVHPNAIRLGINRDADSRWYAESKNYPKLLLEDLKARKLLQDLCGHAGVSKIHIERPGDQMNISVVCAKPGLIIGKKGHDVDSIRLKLVKLVGRPIHLTVVELKKADLDAKILAESIAQQLEKRILFRKAMKRAIQQARRAGALGIKVTVSGRIGGAEIARSETYKEGRIPLHTFRANIDYALGLALTTYGIIGVKVWIYKGDIHKKQFLLDKRD